jgi:hypothetical protein
MYYATINYKRLGKLSRPISAEKESMRAKIRKKGRVKPFLDVG